MKSSVLIAIITTTIIVGAACAIYYLDDNDNSSPANITYVLGTGENSSKNPTSYVDVSKTFTLNDPYSDMYLFEGWYTTPTFDEGTEITELPANYSDNLTIYAKWCSLVGKGFILSITGTEITSSGPFSLTYYMNGSVEYRYIWESDDKYLMTYNRSLTYGWTEPSKNTASSTTIDNNDTYWTNENDKVWTYLGTEIITTIAGEKECSVYECEGEKQYIGDDWIPYLITYESSESESSINLEYKFISLISFTPVDYFTLSIITEDGITVDGDGSYEPGSRVILKATVSTGTSFKGWYDNTGTLLSTDLNYTTDPLGSNTIITACNDEIATYYTETGTPMTFTNGNIVMNNDTTWTITNSYDSTETANMVEGSSPIYTFTEPGLYCISISGTTSDGTPLTRTFTVLADGVVERVFKWTYNTDHSYTLSILFSDYVKYKEDPIYRRQGTSVHNLNYVTYEDETIKKLAVALIDKSENMTTNGRANFLLAFVQCIPYDYEEYYGNYEYWRFPVETLYDNTGDCEDTSILYAALGKAMNYDVCLFLFTGHMAAGVALEDYSYVNTNNMPAYFLSSDTETTEYYFCETTGDITYPIGRNSGYSYYRSINVVV